jgi:hypothetical protein
MWMGLGCEISKGEHLECHCESSDCPSGSTNVNRVIFWGGKEPTPTSLPFTILTPWKMILQHPCGEG